MGGNQWNNMMCVQYYVSLIRCHGDYIEKENITYTYNQSENKCVYIGFLFMKCLQLTFIIRCHDLFFLVIQT